MSPQSRRETSEAIEKLAQREGEIRGDESSKISRAFDQAERFVKYAYAFGAMIAAVAVWTARVQWVNAEQAAAIHKLEERQKADTTLQEARSEKLEARIDAFRDQRQSDQQVVATLQNTIVANKAERGVEISSLRDEDRRQQALWDTWLRKIDDMWDARVRGESNKEYFFREHGRAAPAAPEK